MIEFHRLCVKSDVELRKCEIMRKAAYSRDIRPAIMCVQSAECIKSVCNLTEPNGTFKSKTNRNPCK